jgi:hypothetical protein
MTAHSEYVADSFEHAGLTVEIVQDMESRSRDDLGDHLGTIAAEDYGDERIRPNSYAYVDVAEHIREKRLDGCTVIPLYLADYGSNGARIYESDSPNAFIYVTAEKIAEEYKGARPTHRAQARKVLRAEVEEFDNLLQGNVFGIVVRESEDGDMLESVWGFVGEYDSEWMIRESAREMAEGCAEQVAAEGTERAEWAARDVVTV